MVSTKKLIEQGYVTKIEEIEKKHYLTTLKEFYEDDEAVNKDLVISHPRWSIISGYYSMHNISKYLIAKKLSIKISSERTHTTTLIIFGEYIRQKETKEKILDLLKKAKEIYDIINPRDWNIAKYLSSGKQNREKVNYYTAEYDQKAILLKASEFRENLVQPYLHILKGLVKND